MRPRPGFANARGGTRLLVSDYVSEGASLTTSAILQAGVEARGVAADVIVDAQVAAVAQTPLEAFGWLDRAFNDADVAPAWSQMLPKIALAE